jgi:hypothetical protein
MKECASQRVSHRSYSVTGSGHFGEAGYEEDDPVRGGPGVSATIGNDRQRRSVGFKKRLFEDVEA